MMVFNPSVSGGGSKETAQITVNCNSGDAGADLYVGYLNGDGEPCSLYLVDGTTETISALVGSVISGYVNAYGSYYSAAHWSGEFQAFSPAIKMARIVNGPGTISAL